MSTTFEKNQLFTIGEQLVINSEDQIFNIMNTLFREAELMKSCAYRDSVRYQVRLHCSDDKYYQLLNHLIGVYFECSKLDEIEYLLSFGESHCFESSINLTKSDVLDNSFYGFGIRDFCKQFDLDFYKFKSNLELIGIDSTFNEFSEKIIGFRVWTYINSLKITVTKEIRKLFFDTAKQIATQSAINFENNNPLHKHEETKVKSKKIKLIYTPMGGQNGKKHH